MKLKGIFLLAVVMGISFNLDAQRWKAKRYEVAIGIGTTHIFGDIGGGASLDNWMGIKDIRFDATRPSLAFDARYKLNQRIALKYAFIYGYGYGNDKNSYHEIRGLSFTRQLFENSVQFEYYLMSEDTKFSSSAMYYNKGMASNFSRLGLYLFTGVGGTIGIGGITESNPAYLLPPDKETRKTFAGSLVVPGGIGLKLLLNPDMMAGFEFGGRYAFSDYIDGYNAFGYSGNKSNDIYYFTTFSVIYRIKNDRYNVPLFMQPLLHRRVGKTKGPLNPPK